MKRMLKKLSAIALAGAMVLSLCVTALADDPEANALNDDPNPGASATVARGNANGTVASLGGMPADVICIKMPTAATGVFDLWIDPHNLIRESNNALNTGSAGVDGSAFAEDTLVYFKNSGDTTTFSKTSDDINIINKSNVPVSVVMDAKWTKASSDTYTLAKDAADLAAAKADGKASLYLELKDSKNNSAAVVEQEKGTPVMSVATDDTDATAGAGTAANIATAQATVKSLIKSIKFEWTDAADEQDIRLINKGVVDTTTAANSKIPANWVFTFTEASKKTPVVTMDASKLPNYTTLTGTTLKTDNAYKTAASTAISITETTNMDGSITYSLPNGMTKAEGVVKIQKGTTDVALITIEWDYEALGELCHSTTPAATSYVVTSRAADASDTTKYTDVKLKICAASGDGALITSDINRVEGAYGLAANSNNTALEWKIDDSFNSDETKFQKLSFNLTAAITDGDVCAKDWDTAYTSSSGTTLAVTWKVNSCDAVDPSVVVTSPLESNTGTAVLTVDWGYGASKATTISAASYTANSVTALPLSNVAIDENTVTITSVAALFAEAGANGVLTLTFSNPDTGYSKDITVDLKTAAS